MTRDGKGTRPAVVNFVCGLCVYLKHYSDESAIEQDSAFPPVVDFEIYSLESLLQSVEAFL